ncbi:MAG TPA: ABC transporter ATP-binding protein, partial [Ktedonobacteraceae bacterium]|nr:ABC transporter ATP-binding protein [Ktedonobacteraceae bacterium]
MEHQEHEASRMISVSSASTPPIIRLEKLKKHYVMGRRNLPVLHGLNLEIKRGEMVAIMGPSGSGKSTLMNILGCLDRPSDGRYILDGVPVSEMSKNELADVRNQKIGFVFQGFNLLQWMTALGNVELPLVYTGLSTEERQERANRALKLVGLSSRANHRPAELSGGQQQRVAIARALVTTPTMILADEPTGNLDSHTSIVIIAMLQRLNARGMTMVLVTHEPDIAAYCRRKVVLRDGRIVEDSINPNPLIAEVPTAQPAEGKKVSPSKPTHKL